MSLTEIDLSKNAKDASLTPAKISTNPADNFTFPNNVIASGQLNTPTIGDLTSLLAIDITNRYLKDTTGVISLDWLNRLLKASDGSTSINFSVPGTVDIDAILDATGHSIIHVADPVNANDAANKTYVDTVAQGLLTKAACTAATTAALTPVTAAGSGVGKTLTENANGVLTVDGINTWIDVVHDGGSTNPAASNPASRVLVKDQANPIDNGIYCVTDKGSVSTPFILTRAIDFDGSPANEVRPGDFTFIGEGTVNASSGWTVSGSIDPIVVDTDPIPFIQFSGAGQIIAGQGLTKTGNELDVHPLDASLLTHVGDISVQRDPAGAVGLSGSGVTVNVDGTYIGISANALTLLNPTSHTVAGANTQVQYNNSGAFAGATGVTTDGTNLSITGTVTTNTITGNGVSALNIVTPSVNNNATNLNVTAGGVASGVFTAGSLTLAGGAGVGGGLGASLKLTGWIGFPYGNADAILSSGGLSSNGGNVIFQYAGSEIARMTSSLNMGIGNNNPDASALLDLTSTTRGFLQPRMTTTQRNGIASPATGLEIYNTTTSQVEYYNGTVWSPIGNTAVAGANTQIQFNNSGVFGASASLAWDGTHLLVNQVKAVSGSLSLLPASDSITAIALKNAAGSATVLNVDTSNTRVGINNNAPAFTLDVGGSQRISGTLEVDGASIGLPTNGSSSIGMGCAGTTEVYFQSTGRGGNVWGVLYDSFGSRDAFAWGGGSANYKAHMGMPLLIQVAANSTELPDPSSILQLNSTSLGFLPPVMTTTQKNAIGSPATGLIVYDSTLGFLQEYNGTSWVSVSPVTTPGGSSGNIQYNNGGVFGGASNINTDGTNITVTGSGSVSLTSPLISSGAQTGGSISLSTGINTGPGNTSGGGITLTTGSVQSGTLANGNLTGGSITLSTGLFVNGLGTPTVQGGSINLTTGQVQGSGGTTTVLGGGISLSTGPILNAGTMTGGSITLSTGSFPNASGSNATTGGSILLTSGNPNTGADTGGNITLTSFTPANGGNLVLTGNGSTSHGNIVMGGGFIRPSTNSITALQLTNAAGTTILDVDTSNKRIGINNTAPAEALHVGTTSVGGKIRVDNTQGSIYIGNQSQSQIAILTLNAANTPSFELFPVGLSPWYISAPGSGQPFPGDFTIGQSIGQSNSLVIDITNGNMSIAPAFNAVAPNASAALDIQGTTMGFLQPRLTTTQRNAIASPATGLSIYNTTTNDIEFYNGTTWVGSATTSLTSAHIFVGNASNLATDTAMTGDVSITNTGVTSIAAGLAAHIVTREVPSGTVNGSNTTFTLANTPVAGTECVFLNGLLQNVGALNDYTISGATITFNTAPDAGGVILVNYIK